MEASIVQKKTYEKAINLKNLSGLVCPCCGTEIGPSDAFCAECGNQLEVFVTCPCCGEQAIRDRDSFCANCGTPLQPSNKADESLATVNESVPRSESPEVIKAKQDRQKQRELFCREKERQITTGSNDVSDSNTATLRASIKADPKILESLKKNMSKALSLEELKVAEAEKKAKLALEEEQSRLRVLNDLNGKVITLSAENVELRRKNHEAIQANAELDSKYKKILEEKARLEKTGRKPLWKCNYCGNLHNDPTDCVQPELGGTWVW